MRRTILAIGLAAAAVGAGCGSDDDPEPSTGAASDKPRKANAEPPDTVLKLAVETKPGQITFDRKRLTAPAGRIGIELTNPTQLGHNVRIQTGKKCCFAPGHEDLGGTTTGVGKITGTVELKPGRYFYLCSVGGHWQLGQRGTLVVR
jgi:plastocyanin